MRAWDFFLISSSERYTKCLDAQFFAKYFIFKARQDQVHSYLQIYNVRPISTNDLGNKKFLVAQTKAERSHGSISWNFIRFLYAIGK